MIWCSSTSAPSTAVSATTSPISGRRPPRRREPGDVRPLEDWSKKPSGKGWVVEIAGYTYHRGKEGFIRNTLLTNIARLGFKEVPKDPKKSTGAGTPPPKGGKVAQPPVAPAGGVAAKGPKTVNLDSTKEPIKGNVHHVLLFNALAKESNVAGGFEIINTGQLPRLVASESGTAAGPGGPGGSRRPGGTTGGMAPSGMSVGPMGGQSKSGSGAAGAAALRGTWQSLSSRATADAGNDRNKGGYGGKMTPSKGPLGGNAAQPEKTTPPPLAGATRTEFIILFIWEEPTPSDELRSAGAKPGTTGSTPPGSMRR